MTQSIALPSTDKSRSYNLDGLGNWRRTMFDPVGGNQLTQIRRRNGLNEITSTAIETTKTGFSHDGTTGTSNGNLANDGVRTYQWDAFNRLKQINKTVPFRQACKTFAAGISGGAVAGGNRCLTGSEAQGAGADQSAVGFACLADATAGCVARGRRAAVQRRFEDHRAWHRAWMLRCYALLCSAVLLRVIGGLSEVIGADRTYPVVAWACWPLPPAAVEAI